MIKLKDKIMKMQPIKSTVNCIFDGIQEFEFSHLIFNLKKAQLNKTHK